MNLYLERLYYFLPYLLTRNIIVTVILLSLWLSMVSPQSPHTINIQRGTATEGDSFELTCLISGNTLIGSSAIAWAKDNDIIVWSQNGAFTDLDKSGDYTWDEIDIGGIVHFTLYIALLSSRHNGLYKCFLANGGLMSYNEISSSITNVHINATVNPSQTETPAAGTLPPSVYFPDDEWPKCTPKMPYDEFQARIYTETIIRCVSTIGNPLVSLTLFVDGSIINPSSPENFSGNFIEQVHTFNVMPEHQGNFYICQIRSDSGQNNRCVFGKLQVQLFEEHVIEMMEGNDVVVCCNVGSRNTIEWKYTPQIQSSRLDDSEPGLVRITNVQNVDNGTIVTCKLVGYDIEDHVQIIVNPTVMATMQTVTNIGSTSDTLTNESHFGSTMTTDNSSSTFIFIIVGAGGGASLIILIIGIIVVCICCGKQGNTDDLSEDNKPTRISTGYVWDRELSKKLQESPIPSPRLSERNPHHASALQALQETQEDQSDAMSPTLAYALTHLSDDDLDSDNDTLKKPNRQTEDSYETVGETTASNLNRDASVHSNVYTSVSNLAPNTPAPSPPAQNEDGPTYAMPEKVRKESKKYNAPVYATPDKTPKQNEPISIPALNPMYAVVRADPENPVVRALSQRQNGVINGAYKPDELESGD